MITWIQKRLRKFTPVPKKREERQRLMLLEAELVEPVDETAHRRLVKVGLFALIIFFTWAALTPVDETVTGEGRILPLAGARQIQHQDGGQITEILVTDGGPVRAGQPLVLFDRTEEEARLRQLRARQAALNLTIERRRAMADGRDFAPSEDSWARLSASERAVFEIEAQASEARIAVLQSNSRLAVARLDVAKVRLRELARREEILTRRLVDLDSLFTGKQVVSRLTRDQAEIDLIRTREEIAETKSEAREAELSIRKANQEELEFNVLRRQEALRAIAGLEAELAEVDEEVRRLAARADRVAVLAPASGVVQNLAVNAPGQIVSPGAVIGEVIPDDVDLIAELLVPASRIGEIQPGVTALVKVLTFDFTRYGGIEAEVIGVSPSSTVQADGSSFYEVRLGLSSDYVGPAQADNLIRPGLAVVADLQIGRKSVLEYFLKPLRVISDGALSES
ncbi:MAG: HlyD family type I secretion periplasmic adaptor subunit [Pseudomonadota bacterium]